MLRLARMLGTASLTILSALGCEERVPGRVDLDDTELISDGVAPTPEQIADALRPEGVLGMSPEAKANYADDMSAHVDVVPASSGIGTLAEPLVEDIVADFADEAEHPTLLALMNEYGEVYTSSLSGWNLRAARDELLDIVADEQRAAVREVLLDPDLGAYDYWLQVYDVGAEFVGRDLFIILPETDEEADARAVVILMEYEDV